MSESSDRSRQCSENRHQQHFSKFVEPKYRTGGLVEGTDLEEPPQEGRENLETGLLLLMPVRDRNWFLDCRSDPCRLKLKVSEIIMGVCGTNIRPGVRAKYWLIRHLYPISDRSLVGVLSFAWFEADETGSENVC